MKNNLLWSALTSDASNAVNDAVYKLLANGVVATGIYGSKIVSAIISVRQFKKRTVVGSILLATNQQLRVEELLVGASADFVDWLWRGISRAPEFDRGELRIRTEGSRSTKIERGTYLPLPVSVKKVSGEPPSAASLFSGSRRPSALRPCSRR